MPSIITNLIYQKQNREQIIENDYVSFHRNPKFKKKRKKEKKGENKENKNKKKRVLFAYYLSTLASMIKNSRSKKFQTIKQRD